MPGTHEGSPQQATGYQKEVDPELSEVTKQASGNRTLRDSKSDRGVAILIEIDLNHIAFYDGLYFAILHFCIVNLNIQSIYRLNMTLSITVIDAEDLLGETSEY